MRESFCRLACIDRKSGEFFRCGRAISLRHQSLHGGSDNGPLPEESLERYTLSELSNIEVPSNCVRPDIFLDQVEAINGGKYTDSVKEAIEMVKKSRGIT